jgi:DNA-binding CsgD family transcriptional regulator
MVTDKLKELEAAKARLAELQKVVHAQMQKELASLPGKYGFDNIDDFVRAVKGASGGGSRRRARGGRRRGPKPAAAGRRRRRRAVITDSTRSEVKKMVESGKTGRQIAKAVGISLPSVQNIKKALGLVKARK